MRIVVTQNFQIAINEYGNSDSEKFCILMPGRLDTKDYINFTSHGNFLANLGYHVIAIDPPCTWDSPGDLHDYTTTTYVQAINELIALFGNKKTLLLGHSRGGATAMLASTNPHVEALVLINSSYASPTPPNKDELVNDYLPENRDLPPGNIKTEEQVKFMLPMVYFEDGNKHNPLSVLKNFNGAKLIIHATRDEYVSLDTVKTIYSELNDPKMYLWINCAHDYRLSPEAIDQVNQSLEDFVNLID